MMLSLLVSSDLYGWTFFYFGRLILCCDGLFCFDRDQRGLLVGKVGHLSADGRSDISWVADREVLLAVGVIVAIDWLGEMDGAGHVARIVDEDTL